MADSRSEKQSDATANSYQGTLQSFNYSPKGSLEGLLLETKDGILQFNFPHEYAEHIAKLVDPGDKVTVIGDPHPDDRPGDHPVFQLNSIEPKKGNAFSVNGKATFEGKVARFNYALHGECNGVVLKNGDFVHLKPRGAELAELEIGQKVEVEGTAKPLIVGKGRVIEAFVINGIVIEDDPASKNAAGAKKAAGKKAPKKIAAKKAVKEVAKAKEAAKKTTPKEALETLLV